MVSRAFRLIALVVLALLARTGIAHAAIVINELDYDQPGADTGEFIELYNNGSSPVSLNGYSIRLVNGATGLTYQTITITAGVTLAANDYYVICADGSVVPNCDQDITPNSDLIQNGSPDALSLLLNGSVVDALSYEGDVASNTEGSSVPTASAENNNSPNQSLSRCGNGVDSNDNSADFRAVAASPGAANSCAPPSGSVGACGDAVTRVSAIQGSGSASPLLGNAVNVEAVVTADFQDGDLNGFFLQESAATADADPATSEGLFIYEGSLNADVSVGQVVRVRGTVSEQDTLTELNAVSDVVVCNTTALPAASLVTLPAATTTYLERYEGMLVQIPQTLTVTGNYVLGRYGSLDLSADGRLYQPTHDVEPGEGALALQDLNERSRIILDDANNSQNPNPIPYKDANNTRRLGDTLAGLSGVLSGQFNLYRLHPLVAPVFASPEPREATPKQVGGRLRVAALNVLNFFTTIDNGAPHPCGPSGGMECRGADSALEFERQRTKILNALQALNADIVGLMEIENNASAAVQNLVEGLNSRVGAGTYAFINTGTIGTDAIKLALLYKPSKVAPFHPPAILTSSVDPNFVDNKNRPSLAQTFDELGTNARLTVVVNHLKSKGSDCDDIGDPDVGDGQGNCNVTRTRAATALSNWLANDPTGSGDPDFLVLGDFNAYAKEDPIVAMKQRFTSLIETRLGPNAYSYQFDGQSGYLDYAFASNSLSSQVTGVTEWHINSDEPVVLNYNTEFKTDDPFSPADPFAASDHDPILVGINLFGAPGVPALLPVYALLTALLLLGAGSLWLRRFRDGSRAN